MSKPKRGHKYFHKELKQDVWFNRMVSPTNYFICLQEDQQAATADDFINVHPDELVPAIKPGSSIQAKAKVVTPEEKKISMELSVFFASQIRVIPYLCDNCNQPLYAFTQHDKLCCVAHILPKEKEHGFPMLAIHPANKMFLCAKGGCHHKYDNAKPSERAQMKCYSLALDGFGEMVDVLTLPYKIKAYEYLNLDITPLVQNNDAD